MAEDLEGDTDLDQSIDEWLLDIRDRQLQSEACRKKYFTRESSAELFIDSDIQHGKHSLMGGDAKLAAKAAGKLLERIKRIGPVGVDKVVRNGYVPFVRFKRKGFTFGIFYSILNPA